jgi:hypothetical protein
MFVLMPKLKHNPLKEIAVSENLIGAIYICTSANAIITVKFIALFKQSEDEFQQEMDTQAGNGQSEYLC